MSFLAGANKHLAVRYFSRVKEVKDAHFSEIDYVSSNDNFANTKSLTGQMLGKACRMILLVPHDEQMRENVGSVN